MNDPHRTCISKRFTGGGSAGCVLASRRRKPKLRVISRTELGRPALIWFSVGSPDGPSADSDKVPLQKVDVSQPRHQPAEKTARERRQRQSLLLPVHDFRPSVVTSVARRNATEFTGSPAGQLTIRIGRPLLARSILRRPQNQSGKSLLLGPSIPLDGRRRSVRKPAATDRSETSRRSNSDRTIYTATCPASMYAPKPTNVSTSRIGSTAMNSRRPSAGCAAAR